LNLALPRFSLSYRQLGLKILVTDLPRYSQMPTGLSAGYIQYGFRGVS
jgi:hypothetical protein